MSVLASEDFPNDSTELDIGKIARSSSDLLENNIPCQLESQLTNREENIPFVEDNTNHVGKLLRNAASNNVRPIEQSSESSPHILCKTNKKREVFRYEAEWMVASVAWSNQISESFILALSSFIDDYSNRVDLVKLSRDYYNENIAKVASFEQPYPASKILWIPQPTSFPRLIATSADYLRIWRVIDKETAHESYVTSEAIANKDEYNVILESLLNTNQGSKNCAPLTSFDWNEVDPSIIVTAGVDTCCSVWDLEVNRKLDQTQFNNSNTSLVSIDSTNPTKTFDNFNLISNLRSQIVAHNDEVYDVSFSKSGGGRDIFASAGGDGSVRLFDLRRLSTSTMLFEYERNVPNDRKALVRVACNKQDPNMISAFSVNSKEILMIDIRRPGIPIETLRSHLADVNSMSWAPHSAHHLCSGANDQQALIWDLSKLPDHIEEPFLAYRANGKINTVSWSNAHSNWIAIGYQNFLELLRV